MERIVQSMAEGVCVHEGERHLTKESGWDDRRDKTSKRVGGIGDKKESGWVIRGSWYDQMQNDTR